MIRKDVHVHGKARLPPYRWVPWALGVRQSPQPTLPRRGRWLKATRPIASRRLGSQRDALGYDAGHPPVSVAWNRHEFTLPKRYSCTCTIDAHAVTDSLAQGHKPDRLPSLRVSRGDAIRYE